MPRQPDIKAQIRPGTKTYYIRGTVRVGDASRAIYETTGIRAGPGAKTIANELARKREEEIRRELLEGPPPEIVTWGALALDYCAYRKAKRVARNPALAERPDPEAGYVLRMTDFFEVRGWANGPVAELTQDRVQAYFDEALSGAKLTYKLRVRNSYRAVMNRHKAKEKAKGRGFEFPLPELEEFDVRKQPVNKWLYEEEVRLFYRQAPRHLKLFVATIFGGGQRGGEIIHLRRGAPNYADRNDKAISLEPGREHIYLGWSKNGNAIIRYMPDWWVAMVRAELAQRTDRFDTLFLTKKRKPYKVPRLQKGFLMRTAWKPLRGRVAAIIERLARRRANVGDSLGAERLRQRAAVCRTVTPHWGRHNMVSQAFMRSLTEKEAQQLSGHLDPRMLDRYKHLAPEHGKGLANQIDYGFGNRAKPVQSKKGAA